MSGKYLLKKTENIVKKYVPNKADINRNNTLASILINLVKARYFLADKFKT